jgi:hypothetical protein
MSYIRRAAADDSEFPTLLDIKAAFGFIPNFFARRRFGRI